MRSSPLKPGSKRLKRKPKKKRSAEEELAHLAFIEAARSQCVCAVTRQGGAFDPHHVVEQQWLKREGFPVDDKRNALRLNPDVHANHTTKVKKVPMRCLLDSNLEYAFEVMGVRAIDYLERNYEGTDPRFERAAEDAERAWQASRG